MELYVVMAQRKCAYEGEYAPEALDCMAGPQFDDNPTYLREVRQKSLATNEFDAVEIVKFEFNGDDIESRLFPNQAPISAKLSDNEETC